MIILHVIHLGQAGCMAFSILISCWPSCHFSVDGNAEDAWFKRQKVSQIWIPLSSFYYSFFILCHLILRLMHFTNKILLVCVCVCLQ